MFVYQFVPAEYALQNLRYRRLKVSLLQDMNDPFELLGASLKEPEARDIFKKLKDKMNRSCRLLCFSKRSSNPLMWSHYADKHFGMCLGFVVPEERVLEVTYAPSRLELQIEKSLLSHSSTDSDLVRQLLALKFRDWAYEEEVRMEVRPFESYRDGPLHFSRFSQDLRLFKVFIGPRCRVSKKEVHAAIQPEDKHAVVVSTRPAFQSFRVIPSPASARNRKKITNPSLQRAAYGTR